MPPMLLPDPAAGSMESIVVFTKTTSSRMPPMPGSTILEMTDPTPSRTAVLRKYQGLASAVTP